MSTGDSGAATSTADEIVERLKRAANLKSDAELADLLSVAPATISNWRSRNSVPLKRLKPMCEKYAIPIDYLLTGRAGPDKLLPPALDTETLSYVFRMLDRYGFIKLPRAHGEGYDPARRAAAEFAVIQDQVAKLVIRLAADQNISLEQARRTAFNQLSKRK